jgi:hypothetical protein
MTPSIPHDQTLIRAVERSTRFLTSASTSPIVRRALVGLSYTPAEHQEGWHITMHALGYTPPTEPPSPTPGRDTALEAITELDALDGPLLRRCDAILTYDHPDQGEFVLHGLTAQSGVSAVSNVKTVTGRITHLRSAPNRDDETLASDLAALDSLSERGMDEAYWTRLEGLVEMAQRLPETAPLPTTLTEDELRSRRFEVYKWIRKWSMLANEEITNRNILIQLGLTTRRQRASSDDGEGSDTGSEPSNTQTEGPNTTP